NQTFWLVEGARRGQLRLGIFSIQEPPEWTQLYVLSNDLRRIDRHNTFWRYIFCQHAPGPYDAFVSDLDSRQDDAARTNATVLANSRMQITPTRHVVTQDCRVKLDVAVGLYMHPFRIGLVEVHRQPKGAS